MAASSKPQFLSSTVRGIIDEFNEQALNIASTNRKSCFQALHRVDTSFTEPAAFEFYFKTYREELSVEIRKAFTNLLRSFLGRVNAQLGDPVKSAQRQLENLVLNQREHVELWIKQVCYQHQFESSSDLSLKEIAEFRKWKEWRAPRWLLMQPVGTAAYDRSTAWEREGQSQTDATLGDLCDDKFMLLLKKTVRNVALDAYLQLARVGFGNSPEPDDLANKVERKLKNPMGNPAMSVKEAAHALSRSEPTIYRLVDEGILSWIKGTKGRISTQSVKELIKTSD